VLSLSRRIAQALVLVVLSGACAPEGAKGGDRPAPAGIAVAPPESVGSDAGERVAIDAGAAAPTVTRSTNTLGRIPVLEYHLVGDEDGTYAVSRERFRSELAQLYDRGYRPVSLDEFLSGRFPLAPGQSPALIIFDDASPSQFRYVERDGRLAVDSTSALGIWLDFASTRPDWRPRGLFCLLSGAAAGRSFFGDKGIEGQASAWRFPKVRMLDSLGFDLCNHTLWHARLDKYPDAFVQEQIARGELAIDSAVPGYRVRAFALPLGKWPKNRRLASAGEWRDPKSGRVTRYAYDAVFEVAGGATRSPHDPAFDPKSISRIPLGKGMPLIPTLDRLDAGTGSSGRYVVGETSSAGKASDR
jgi:hypothetical protein